MSYTLAYTGAEIDALLGKIDAIFVAEYGSTIYSEVTAAIAAGNKVIVANAGKVYVYAGQDDNSGYVFTQSGPNASKPNATYVTLSTGNVWSTATVDLATLQQFYASLMEDTASGSIASFPDGAENVPVTELNADIEPIQDLHGYSNPWPDGGNVNIVSEWEKTSNYAQYSVLVNFTADLEPSTTYYLGFVLQSGVLVYCDTLASSQFNTTGTGSFQTLSFTTKSDISGSSSRVLFKINSNNLTASPSFSQLIISKTPITEYSPYANICPISGYTGAEIPVTGKNLYNKNGTGDGFVAGNALLVGNTLDANQYFNVSEYIKIKPSTAYTLQSLIGNAAALCFYDANKGYISGSIYGGETTKTITSPATAAYIRFSVPVANVDTIQLEEGSSATAYEPFGTVYSVSWSDEAGTVYGGHFVVNEDGSVDLTVEDALFTPPSISYYGLYGNDNAPLFYVTVATPVKVYGTTSDPAQNKIYSNKYAATDANSTQALKNYHIRTQSNVASATIFYFRDDRFTSAAEINADLANNPLQIMAVLATPQTYHLDSIGQITTLLGDNNIWANTGDVSVRYRCNTALYIEKKLGGNVQTLSTPRLIGVSPSEGAFDVISGNPINIERVPLSEIKAPELDELTEEPELEPYEEPEELEEELTEEPEAEEEPAEDAEAEEEPEAPEEVR